MGWGDCGEDSQGRNIGYVWSAVCDHTGCDEKIDRGLAYVCGSMHGDDEYSCEKYFCHEHKQNCIDTQDGDCMSLCDDCFDKVKKNGWDEEDEVWKEN